jgi:hypothetical protein
MAMAALIRHCDTCYGSPTPRQRRTQFKDVGGITREEQRSILENLSGQA